MKLSRLSIKINAKYLFVPNHNPHQLPEKTCLVCQRPFHWRKKWAKNWEAVKYCSEACKKQRKIV